MLTRLKNTRWYWLGLLLGLLMIIAACNRPNGEDGETAVPVTVTTEIVTKVPVTTIPVTAPPDEVFCIPLSREMYESVTYLSPSAAFAERRCNYYEGELLLVTNAITRSELLDFLRPDGLLNLFAGQPDEQLAAPIALEELNDDLADDIRAREDGTPALLELRAFRALLAPDLAPVFNALESELDPPVRAELTRLPDEWRAVWHINEAVLEAGGDSLFLLVDVNYRLSLDIAGDPVSGGGLVGGDPVSGGGLIGGDPVSGGGWIGGDTANFSGCSNDGQGVASQAVGPIPTQAPEPTAVARAQVAFVDQWVFQGMPGVNRPLLADIGDGDGVEIAIFDAMPFDGQSEFTVDWVPDPFPLGLSQPVNVPGGTLCNLAFDEHGLFVAGMAHAVAPKADMHLIEVLNSANQGQLTDLIKALEWYRNRRLDENGQTMANTVINLSLGVDPDTPLPDLLRPQLDALRDLGGPNSPYGLLLPDVDAQLPVVSLNYALWRAHLLGAVVVAASGNDSGSLTPPQPAPLGPQVPAALPQVIGVSGNNIYGNRSCFANASAPDLMAPAGDGLLADGGCDSLVTVDQCVQASAANPTDPAALSCEAAIIGPVSFRFTTHGYVYWTGTSFSTPLISGVAAVLLNQTPAQSPDLIAGRIFCAAPNGVLDSALLLSCP